MITVAVIVASDSGIAPLFQFGGLSLLKRAVLTAQKTGAVTCHILIPDTKFALRQELEGDPRITSRIVWGLTAIPPDDSVEHASSWLVFSLDTLFRQPLVQHLAEIVTPGQSFVVADRESTPLLLWVTETHARRLYQALVQEQSLGKAVVCVHRELIQLSLPPEHFLCRLQTEAAVAALEYALLRSLENSKDGIVDVYLNRKFSRPLTRGFLHTPITPNQITILAGVMSVLGAACFLFGGYFGPLFGALLLQFSGVLDCCDGEVARIKFMESPLGDTLDIVCDTIGAITIFLGIGAAVWKNGGSEFALTLGGVLALGGALSFPLVTLAERTEEEGNRRGGWEDALIHTLVTGLTNRDYSILILASALVGQLSWFLWGAAFGSHVFWVCLAWLLFRAGRFARLRSLWKREK
ncbi:MAG: CDP-alcohol phosphatidyltransferase family protein [Candidatus Binatia bacterium]